MKISRQRALRYALGFYFEALTTMGLTAFGAGLVASLLTLEGNATIRAVMVIGGLVLVISSATIRGYLKAREENHDISE